MLISKNVLVIQIVYISVFSRGKKFLSKMKVISEETFPAL